MKIYPFFCSSHLFVLKQKCGQLLGELMIYMATNISSVLVHQFYQLTDTYLVIISTIYLPNAKDMRCAENRNLFNKVLKK